MYEAFYGLKEKAFNLNPDIEYFFMSREHENAFTHLEYAIAETKGFTVITGEIGAGKTTLINYLLYKIQLDVQIGLINNTDIPASQFLRAICREFEIEVDAVKDKVDLMEAFQDFLLEQYAENNRVVLIIDEAQNLSPKIMEEIRMISNLESEKSHLIQMILVGQPELKYKLQRADMKQFAQRISVHFHLKGLDKDEVGSYIRYRLKVGEAKNLNLFDKEAIGLIYENSRGIPRLINILCDTALVYGYADGLKTITKNVIENVIKEREDSGIFAEFEKDIQRLPITISPETIIPEKGSPDLSYERIKLLDKRVDFLETTIDDLKDKIRSFTDTREKRDSIVIELFKLLEDSMKSRMRLLKLVGRIQNTKNDKNKKGNGKESQSISIVRS